MRQNAYGLEDLLRIMTQLRDPETGCPWDREQTFETIVPSTIEEAYELADAIHSGDHTHVAEELGDLLFQVVFYAQLGSEQGHFDFHDVVSILSEKLIRRHPHVFAPDGRPSSTGLSSVDVVKRSWELIKAQEREARAKRGVLADVPFALPALTRAQKLQKRAASVGFDWVDPNGVMRKLEEEVAELEAALSIDDSKAIADELGDVMFTLVNLSRHLGVDAETALREANDKFARRFHAMEHAASKPLSEIEAAEWDRLWESAKRATSPAHSGD